jgi:hypothetical protein
MGNSARASGNPPSRLTANFFAPKHVANACVKSLFRYISSLPLKTMSLSLNFPFASKGPSLMSTSLSSTTIDSVRGIASSLGRS